MVFARRIFDAHSDRRLVFGRCVETLLKADEWWSGDSPGPKLHPEVPANIGKYSSGDSHFCDAGKVLSQLKQEAIRGSIGR
jgi:hypothetical protein